MGFVEKFWDDPETVEVLGLSQDQIDHFRQEQALVNENRAEVRKGERRAYMRMLRIMTQAPVNQERLELSMKRLESMVLLQHRNAVNRVLMFREGLTLEQWENLIQERPHAVQVGRFRPVPTSGVARALITDEMPADGSGAEGGEPPAESVKEK
ncbi:MAG: hypothetical protein K8R59_06385 [Thermoanaerobaculales bacterium]|nr:hypothetical protein [Thermoanaerobaculales bacterium]